MEGNVEEMKSLENEVVLLEGECEDFKEELTSNEAPYHVKEKRERIIEVVDCKALAGPEITLPDAEQEIDDGEAVFQQYKMRKLEEESKPCENAEVLQHARDLRLGEKQMEMDFDEQEHEPLSDEICDTQNESEHDPCLGVLLQGLEEYSRTVKVLESGSKKFRARIDKMEFDMEHKIKFAKDTKELEKIGQSMDGEYGNLMNYKYNRNTSSKMSCEGEDVSKLLKLKSACQNLMKQYTDDLEGQHIIPERQLHSRNKNKEEETDGSAKNKEEETDGSAKGKSPPDIRHSF